MLRKCVTNDLPALYFGPITSLPSWNWVGADVAARLSRIMAVKYFCDLDGIPENAVVFWIKCPATDEMSEAIRKKRLVVLFFPVDCFRDEEHIRTHAAFIHTVRMVCLHSRSLARFFSGTDVQFVDHYNKYGIAPTQRMPGKTSLWIGAFQYVPYVMNALLLMSRPPANVILLTDADCLPARTAAIRNADNIGLLDFERHLNKGLVDIQIWSAARQREALLTCRVAFDVKYLADFNQFHKPPTKIQKYLCSGIPSAINADIPFRDQLGGQAASLEEIEDMDSCASIERLEFASELSARLSLDRIATQYRHLAALALS